MASPWCHVAATTAGYDTRTNRTMPPYVPFNHRLAYLSAVKDFADGEVVAWNPDPTPHYGYCARYRAQSEEQHVDIFAEWYLNSLRPRVPLHEPGVY